MGRILTVIFPQPNDLIHRTAVNGIFELISGIAVGFRYAIEEVAPVTRISITSARSVQYTD